MQNQRHEKSPFVLFPSCCGLHLTGESDTGQKSQILTNLYRWERKKDEWGIKIRKKSRKDVKRVAVNADGWSNIPDRHTEKLSLSSWCAPNGNKMC